MPKMSWCFGCNSDEEAFIREGCIDFGYGIDDIHGRWNELDDSYRSILEELFNDHKIDIGVAECLHLIYPNEGETHEQLRDLLRSRLNKVAEYFPSCCGCCDDNNE